MSNQNRRELFAAALKPEEKEHQQEEKPETSAGILHQQQPYSEKDLPPVSEFADLDKL